MVKGRRLRFGCGCDSMLDALSVRHSVMSDDIDLLCRHWHQWVQRVATTAMRNCDVLNAPRGEEDVRSPVQRTGSATRSNLVTKKPSPAIRVIFEFFQNCSVVK